jgi:hypothetical protein
MFSPGSVENDPVKVAGCGLGGGGCGGQIGKIKHDFSFKSKL